MREFKAPPRRTCDKCDEPATVRIHADGHILGGFVCEAHRERFIQARKEAAIRNWPSRDAPPRGMYFRAREWERYPDDDGCGCSGKAACISCGYGLGWNGSHYAVND